MTLHALLLVVILLSLLNVHLGGFVETLNPDSGSPLVSLFDPIFWHNQGRLARLQRAFTESKQQGSFNVNIRNMAGWSLLHFAAEYNDYAAVKFLLKEGGDINAQENDGWTPLHFASFHQHYKIVDLLLEHNADPSIINIHSAGPASFLRNKNVAYHEKLIHAGMLMSMNRNNAETPSELLNLVLQGGDPEFKNVVGWSAIHFAANHGESNIVKELLNNGANINSIEHDGWTALMFAVSMGHTTVVEVILNHGAEWEFTSARRPEGSERVNIELTNHIGLKALDAHRSSHSLFDAGLARGQSTKKL